MKQKNYINVSISVAEEDFEIAYGILTDFDFLGMEEKFDEIILSFEEKNWNTEVENRLKSELQDLLPNAKINKIEILSEKNWNEEWEKNVEAIQINENIGIAPEWKLHELNSKLKIIINPKMSFGTGQHSTTKLMTKMIEKTLKPNQIWIDAGTGTGILAILAAKLGAKKVFAFDNDEWSFENALENVKLNKVEEIVEIQQAKIEDYDFPESDCICANMFLNLIISSFPKFYNSLKNNDLSENNFLLVSGILVYDREELLENATKNGFILVEESQDLEWCVFKFKKQNK
jgi:ribosomal protein L11 methyltransferase